MVFLNKTGKQYLCIVAFLLLLLNNTSSFGQCGSFDFYANDSTACIPQVIKFKVTGSPPAGTTYRWDFGSGYNTGTDSAIFLYSNSGKFDVTVELSFPNATKCVITKKGFIEAGFRPKADIVTDKAIICIPNDTVLITDKTLKSKTRTYIIEGVKYDNLPAAYKHQFSSNVGTRNISVIIKDTLGCEAIDEFKNIVTIPALFSFDFTTDSMNGCTNRYANFRFKSIDTGQTPSSFLWTFQNASPTNESDSVAKNIFYTKKDSSDVTLKVTTNEGCTYELKKSKFMTLEDPIALQVNVTKQSPCVGEYITYEVTNAQSTDLTWNFFPDDFVKHASSNYGITGEHRTAGSKVSRVTQNYKGCLSTTDIRGKVNVVGPEAKLTANKVKSCFSTDTIVFTNTSIEPVGETITYRWNIYDQNGNGLDSATTKNHTYTFKNYGLYSVRLIAKSNTGGCVDTLLMKDYVELNKLNVNFDFASKPACISQNVTFVNRTRAGSSLSPNKYSWRIYDKNNNQIGSSTKDSFLSNFADTGKFSVSLVVSNQQGCYDSLYKKDSVLILKPKVIFHISDSTPCAGEKVTIWAEQIPKLSGIVPYWVLTNTSYTNPLFNASLLTDSGDIFLSEPGIYDFNYTYYAKLGPACKDTFIGKAKIKVSGTSISIASSNVDDCLPLQTQLTSNILRNNNYKNSNSSITYSWKALDKPSTSFTSATAANTACTITTTGRRGVQLVYTNGAGCKDSSNIIYHDAGIVASFSVAPLACLDKKTTLINVSTLSPTKYKWFSDSTGISFTPNDTSKNPFLVINRLGRFPVTMVAYKKGCSDTMTTNVTSVKVVAEYSSKDSNSFCAPVLVDFESTSANVTSWNWKFGDGDSAVTNTGKASHVYFKNSPASGFDTRLIVKNNYGCIDTLYKPNYIKIIGPIADMEMKNIKGCEKLDVTFINKSSAYSRFYLDFGDGSVLDSTSFSNHIYQLTDLNKLSQFFKPQLILYDKLGCFVQFIPKDSIFVIQNAIAKFEMEKDTGCELFKAKFINKSERSNAFEWDFNADGLTDNTDINPFHFYNAGSYFPTLIAKNATGCHDTLKSSKQIFVHPKPKAIFETFPDSTCYNFPIYVYDKSLKSKDSAKNVKWYYDFGEEFKLTDTSTFPNASNIYTTLYGNVINFSVTNANGCKDSVKKVVYIRDTIDPLNNGFSYISVENNKDISLNWRKSQLSIFREYHIYQDEANVLTNLYNSKNISDTNFLVNTNIDVNARRYCYVSKITDTCLRTGARTDAHCNIFLRVLDTFLGATQLRWTHYEGWPQRAAYEVYRKAPNDTFKRIATLKGDVNVYIDDSLCDVEYCYYVVCIHPNGVWKSRSNNACNTPKVGALKDVPIIDVVTVQSDAEAKLKWHLPPTNALLSNFEIYRSTGLGGLNMNKVDNASASPYFDFKVKTQINPYTYSIRVKDICGNYSGFSLPANSIFLDGINDKDTIKLTWNPYINWKKGVAKYLIEMKDKNGIFQPLGTTNASQTTYNVPSLSLDVADSLCLRVIAIEDSTVADSSYSNTRCIAPKSRVYVPTAFSPNGDGKNDVFKPVSLFLHNDKTNNLYGYTFEIFNRWGEMVYKTDDVRGGWDGTYLGKKCMPGSYLWRMNAVGLDGEYHSYYGSVLLLN